MRHLAAVPACLLAVALVAAPVAGAHKRASRPVAPPRPALKLVGNAVQGQPVVLRVAAHAARGVKVRRMAVDFGDGRRISRRVLSGLVRHTYARGGSFVVRLTVTDARGRTRSATRKLNVAIPMGDGVVMDIAPSPAPLPAGATVLIDGGAVVITDADGAGTLAPGMVTTKLTVPPSVSSVPISLAYPSLSELGTNDAPASSGLSLRRKDDRVFLDVAPGAPEGTTQLTFTYTAFEADHVHTTARTQTVTVVVGPPGTPITAEGEPAPAPAPAPPAEP